MTDSAKMASKLASEVLVGSLEWPGERLGGLGRASDRLEGMSGRVAARGVLERRLEAVSDRGVEMSWTFAEGEDAERGLERDAMALAGLLGTSGLARVVRVSESGGTRRVRGLMPWKSGRRGVTWEDATVLL